MAKRVFLIVLDSFGIGGAPDAAAFGDEGSNTLAACAKEPGLCVPNMARLGLFNIDGVAVGTPVEQPAGAYARLVEASAGKDTTIGHWEIAGVESKAPLPTFPNGFPAECVAEFERRSGYKTIVNKPYSGTDVLRDFAPEHLATGALILYTSADSVFQLAAHEDLVPIEELYRVCEIAREMLVGDWGVGRVIARPFVGNETEGWKRTPRRHDFSLLPPAPTVLDAVSGAGMAVTGVGKIYDIFAGQGVTRSIKTANNDEGMRATLALAGEDFAGLAFINLVDFDMVYGHRNDVPGYAAALTRFDAQLGGLLPLLREDDLLLVTADHGCDPSTPSTDHSRECVPLLAYGAGATPGSLGTRHSFAHVANTVAAALGLPTVYPGDTLL